MNDIQLNYKMCKNCTQKGMSVHKIFLKIFLKIFFEIFKFLYWLEGGIIYPDPTLSRINWVGTPYKDSSMS